MGYELNKWRKNINITKCYMEEMVRKFIGYNSCMDLVKTLEAKEIMISRTQTAYEEQALLMKNMKKRVGEAKMIKLSSLQRRS